MKVELISFDSMGVRSMATLVETEQGLIFIDPGAALGPRRYGLPPHPLEYRALERSLDRIHAKVEESDVIIITHYHRDHYLFRPEEVHLYKGKVIYAKHPQRDINYSQRIRAHVLFKQMGVESIAKELVFADGREADLGKVKIKFSAPYSHGECRTPLGKVLGVLIYDESGSVLHASDAQGCLCEDSLGFISSNPASLLIISGPPTYLRGDEQLHRNTLELVKVFRGGTIVMDHHLLRDRNYGVYLDILRSARPELKIVTAAEFMGLRVEQLEAYRDVLWRTRGRS